MSNWEYKVISSGKGGFASPALMEKFINDLGQDQWEIIGFHTAPDNALAFTGLARRPTQRDWTLEDAAKAAARAEADKLRAEFEAKFKAATSGSGPASSAEEQAETFLAEEKAGADDGLRRLRDTSRDDDPDAPDEENGNGNGQRDEWDKLAAEDELPTFFDALRPHMRRNQRGPGMSVGTDFLAKKWKLEEADIKGALVECGLQIPADENARPVYVEYEGDLYWVNINRRGEVWINTREKPEPVFRVVQGRRLEEPMAEPVRTEVHPPAAPAESAAPENASFPEESRPAPTTAAPAHSSGSRTMLDKMRGMMRRNRRGHGWSGSFGFLTKALKTDENGLLAQLAEQGLALTPNANDRPIFHEEGDFVYWLNRNQRGEIWINARKGRKPAPGELPKLDDEGAAPEAAAEQPAPHAVTAAGGEQRNGPAPVEVAAGAPVTPSAPNTLGAVRLLLQPKKRGEGVAALVAKVAEQLGQPEDRLLEALGAAGLNTPGDAKTKPTFGEQGGEIFWLNRNARGELWLNAKAAKSAARKSRNKNQEDDGEIG
jgi:hypothetical protein